MTAPAVLGIDLGTSSVKVVLVEFPGRVLAQAVADYPVDRPRPGWSETDPELWWAAIREATAQVRSQSSAVPVAIGLSGQMHGVVLTGPDGDPLRPALLWSDTRAQEQLAVYQALPEEVRARVGNPLTPGMAGPMLGWLTRHEPAVCRRARWVLQPKDWVRGRLTGVFLAEPSDACATLLYDIGNQTWDLDVCAALGIDTSLLPPIVGSAGSVAGQLLPGPADDLGLPPGIPVAAGAGDTAAAALATGLSIPGELQLTIGTGVQLITPVGPPDPLQLRPSGMPTTHTYRAATTSGWYAMAAVLNGGLTLNWVRGVLGASWAELYGAAEPNEPDGPAAPGGEAERASSAATGPASPFRPDDPIFLPYLNGERTPHMDSSLTASWTGLTGRHDRPAMLRAALQGVAFAIRDALDALRARPGLQISDDILLAGGGSTAPGWRQLLADVLGVRLHAFDVSGASGLGAAWTGALAAGLVNDAELIAMAHPPRTLVASPDPARVGECDERHLRTLAVFAALQGLPRPG